MRSVFKSELALDRVISSAVSAFEFHEFALDLETLELNDCPLDRNVLPPKDFRVGEDGTRSPSRLSGESWS